MKITRTPFFLAALVCPLFGADVGQVLIGPWAINTPSFSNQVIDGSTLKDSWVFSAREDITVTSMCVRYAAHAGTPVQYRISVQGVDATTGNPDGNIVASAAFTPPADSSWDNTVQCFTITNDGAGGSLSSLGLTGGTAYSLVVDPCPNSTAPCSGAASPSGVNSSTFTMYTANVTMDRNGFPYSDTYNGSAWAKSGSGRPVYGFRNVTKTIGYLPETSTTGSNINLGAEYAVSFNVPTGTFTSYKVGGIRLVHTSPAAAKSFKVTLYNGTTVIGSQVTVDSDLESFLSNGARGDMYWLPSTWQTLTPGTTYRIGFAPQESNTAFTLNYLTFNDTRDMAAVEGGAILGYSTRSGCTVSCDTTSTAWTDVTKTLPIAQIVVTDITSSGGSGGQVVYGSVR